MFIEVTEKILIGEQCKNIKHPSCTSTIFTYVFPESSCIYLYTKYICWSITKSCPTLCNPMDYACQVSLSFTISQSLLKLHVHWVRMPSNHLILCHPLLLLPSIFPSIRVFSNEPALRMRWPKYWRFSFSIGPSNEHSGLISFRMDWFDLLAVQGTLRVFSSTTIWKRQFFGT